MNKVEAILRQKERSGLLISFIIRIFVAIFIFLGHLNTHHSKWEVVVVAIFSTGIVIISLIFLLVIYKEKTFSLAGYIGTLLDCVIISVLPIIWYNSVGGYDNVVPSYMLKTSLPWIAVVLIAISGLAIRPLYPIIVTAFFVLVWEVIFYIVMNDPRTEITTDFKINIFSEAIIPHFYRTPQISAIIVGGVMASITRTYRTNLKKAVTMEVGKNQLARYFSPNIVDKLTDADSNALKPGGVKQDIAVLFTDIRDFTSMSEKLPPEEVVKFLSDFHEQMVQEIFKYNGTIDKFIGDAIMATFGTPQASLRDADNAYLAAIAMLEKLEILNKVRGQKGLEDIHIGIGIHYGPAIVGNIGTSERLEYTVIGDTVNIASRLESACKTLNKQLCVSESLVNKCIDKYPLSFIEEIQLKGRMQSIRVYSPT